MTKRPGSLRGVKPFAAEVESTNNFTVCATQVAQRSRIDERHQSLKNERAKRTGAGNRDADLRTHDNIVAQKLFASGSHSPWRLPGRLGADRSGK